MKQEVNYIKHQRIVMDKFNESNLLATHISVYNALFMLWNNDMFPKEMCIVRSEVMSLSKVKSNNTYVKCLRELDNAGFLKYKPSNSPLVGSTVELLNFCHSNDIVLTNYCTSGKQTNDSTDDIILNKLIKLIKPSKLIKLFYENFVLVEKNLEKWISEEKTKNIVINSKFNFKNSLKNIGVEDKLISEWLLIREIKKSVNTETAFNSIKKEIDKTNLTPNQAIKISVENSWSGFKKTWYDNIQSKKEKEPVSTFNPNREGW